MKMDSICLIKAAQWWPMTTVVYNAKENLQADNANSSHNKMTINSTTVTNISLLCVGWDKDAGFNQRVKSLRGRKNDMSQN